LGPFEYDGFQGDAYINALTASEATVEVVHAVVENQLSIAVYGAPEYFDENGLIGLKKSFAKASPKIRK
jgi:hypothetical protein